MFKASFSASGIKILLIQLGIAVSSVLFLFFIDEGRYTLSWRNLQQDWLPFLLYLFGIFSGQTILFFLFRNYAKWLRYLISITLGLLLGFIIIAVLILLALLIYHILGYNINEIS